MLLALTADTWTSMHPAVAGVLMAEELCALLKEELPTGMFLKTIDAHWSPPWTYTDPLAAGSTEYNSHP